MGKIKALSFAIFMIPAVAFAADGHYSVSGFFWRVAMFSLFVGIMYWLLKDKINTALVNGVDNVKNSITDAEKQYADSEKELAEYSKKINSMNDELDKMKQNARATAEKEAEMMVDEAEKGADKYKGLTRNMINAETEKAKNDLHNELVLMAVEKAETNIAANTDLNKKKSFIKKSISEIGVN